MLTPGEICSTNEPDKLFMVSYISQYYTTLKDRRPAGGMAKSLCFLETIGCTSVVSKMLAMKKKRNFFCYKSFLKL